MGLFFEIFLAAMAVFGLWCAICLLAQSLLSSRNIGVVIKIFDKETADRLSDLLEETSHAPLSRSNAPLVVLYSEEVCFAQARPTAAEVSLIERQGGEWYVVNVKNNDKK